MIEKIEITVNYRWKAAYGKDSADISSPTVFTIDCSGDVEEDLRAAHVIIEALRKFDEVVDADVKEILLLNASTLEISEEGEKES